MIKNYLKKYMDNTFGDFKLNACANGVPSDYKKIILCREHDSKIVIYTVRSMLAAAGFSQTDEFIVAAAASELATNILRFADEGSIDICIIRDTGKNDLYVELFASDKGPGIRDIDEAMKEHYSSLPNSLGLGLPSVKRIMDEFYIESIPGAGTRVLARKWKKNGKN